MRVVTLVDLVTAGGAERTAVELAKHLASDVSSTLVSSRLRPEAREDPKFRPTIRSLEEAGVRVIAAGRTSKAKPWEWRSLIGMLRRDKVDVLHTHSWGSNFWGPSLARLGGVPVVVAHEQTPFARTGGFRQWGWQIWVNRYISGPFADAIIVPSRWSKAALIHHEGVNPAKIRVIPNAAEPRPITADRAAVRAELGFGEKHFLIIIAAMLRPEKAQEVVIDALPALSSRWPGVHLLIAGGGTAQSPRGTRPELERAASRCGVMERVHFLGHRHDVAELVAAADVAVLSSAHENFPLSLLEYMESGTPIVATTVGGVPEMIEDRVHGLLVPPGESGSMAGAIAEVLSDPDTAKTRAAAAQSRRRNAYNWPAITAQVTDLYRELLQGARG